MLGTRYGSAGTDFSDSRDPVFSDFRNPMIIFSDSRDPVFSDFRNPMIIFSSSRDPNRVPKTP